VLDCLSINTCLLTQRDGIHETKNDNTSYVIILKHNKEIMSCLHLLLDAGILRAVGRAAGLVVAFYGRQPPSGSVSPL
jgi:hypothetical protein